MFCFCSPIRTLINNTSEKYKRPGIYLNCRNIWRHSDHNHRSYTVHSQLKKIKHLCNQAQRNSGFNLKTVVSNYPCTCSCYGQSCHLHTIQQCCNMLCLNEAFISLNKTFSQHSTQIKLNIFVPHGRCHLGETKLHDLDLIKILSHPALLQRQLITVSLLCLTWLTEHVKHAFLACSYMKVLRIACFVPLHDWNCCPHAILHVTYQKCLVKIGRYQPCSFLTCLWTMQKITWPKSRHLDVTVNKSHVYLKLLFST